MGHPRSPARFGVAVRSTGGAYDWRYPQGLPAVNASGAGVTNAASAPAGAASVIPVVAPTLSAPTFVGTTATIAFSGGSGYTTLIPQYSTDGVTWTSAASDIVSPFNVQVPNPATLYYFRALPNNSVGYATNIVNGTSGSSALTLLLSALDHTQSADQTNIGVSNGGQTTWMTDGSGQGYFARIAFNGVGSFLGLNWNFPANISEVYIVFKRRSSSATLGSKRLKLFGTGYPSGSYSNTTFHSANSYSGTDQVTGWSDSPGGGDISCETTDAGFPYPGSGAALPNMGLGSAFDDASWHYSTGVTPYPVQNVTSVVVNDTGWHTEGFYLKRNSNGNHDGAMGKIIDGVVKSAFTGMINCGANLQNFLSAGFGNYSQSTFNEDYTDIFIYAGKPSWFIW